MTQCDYCLKHFLVAAEGSHICSVHPRDYFPPLKTPWEKEAELKELKRLNKILMDIRLRNNPTAHDGRI